MALVKKGEKVLIVFSKKSRIKLPLIGSLFIYMRKDTIKKKVYALLIRSLFPVALPKSNFYIISIPFL
jgi:hypothetical protein